MKVVINNTYGGFSLSSKGTEAYYARKGKKVWWFVNPVENGRTNFDKHVPCDDPGKGYFAHCYSSKEPNEDNYLSVRDMERNDPDLIAVVEELGAEASGRFASLKIVEIPDDVDWVIEEYDGLEWIAESHRTWN